MILKPRPVSYFPFTKGFAVCGLLALAGGCHSPFYADRGAATGGLLGAATGAVIGNQSDNALAGALIGGAAGTFAGAAVGDSIDQDIAARQALITERMGQPLTGAVTVGDLIAMTRAGLGDEVIIGHLQSHGVAQSPQVNDLIYLKNQGVSEHVITAYQHAPAASGNVLAAAGPSPNVVVAPPPIVVQEHHYTRPYWRRPPPRYWRRRPYDCAPGFRWGFSYSR